MGSLKIFRFRLPILLIRENLHKDIMVIFFNKL